MDVFILTLLFLLGIVLISGLVFWQYGGSEYEEKRIIKTSYEDASTVVEDALRYCKFTPKSKYPNRGIINAESKWTMKSFGEDIQVILSEKEEGVHISFYSRCKLETQIIDWGKNEQNAEQFFKAVKVMA
ncbi:hypothetical protein LX73_2260 [Fodinibius salinus]|uniref:DUF1499 domain-containing protein n=1 Tax=Fodinibius salinus TaxID=860790 RepID=A0A5D3YEW9_9BACT|nr:hypothetical protein [Fodinibius salinus]TYP92017.1 hypothetical protein LX73_2260 [Fodinibius salinus]